ncbi:MAG: leucine-rich repeat domain-containing protein [Tannerellaceae bacterium]|nr:leucine-rich repeat domain-containing protein [Tannerellaceae bacterium]
MGLGSANYDDEKDFAVIPVGNRFGIVFKKYGRAYSGTCYSCGAGIDAHLEFNVYHDRYAEQDKGVLTIKTAKAGGEAMPDYNYTGTTPPWYTVRSMILSINMEEGVTAICESAFYECGSLSSVVIPNSVTVIDDRAFFGCSNLSSVAIGNSVTTIGNGAFWACSSLPSVTIPNSVTAIGGFAFWDCSSLSSITIPNSVTAIGGYAFSNCRDLSSIAIPNSVTAIGMGAFNNCNVLKDVTVGWIIPVAYDWDSKARQATLHVPAGTKAIYQAAAGWKEFGKITE